jgi:hypothetical protein
MRKPSGEKFNGLFVGKSGWLSLSINNVLDKSLCSNTGVEFFFLQIFTRLQPPSSNLP